MPTREDALHVWLAILKTLEVFQNIGFVTVGQFLEWLHFGSTLVTATAKEILCPSATDHQKYDNENGQNNKRFHSWFLMLVIATSSVLWGFFLSIPIHLRLSASICGSTQSILWYCEREYQLGASVYSECL